MAEPSDWSAALEEYRALAADWTLEKERAAIKAESDQVKYDTALYKNWLAQIGNNLYAQPVPTAPPRVCLHPTQDYLRSYKRARKQAARDAQESWAKAEGWL